MKNVKLVRLKGTHALNSYFSHRIEIYHNLPRMYQQCLLFTMVKHFTAQFGPGFDKRLNSLNPTYTKTLWGFWIDDQDHCYLYLSNAALTTYLLDRERWENYDLTQFDFS